MIKHVEQDSSLRALVTMYYMRDSNNIFIVPSIKGHVVNMGNCEGYEGKFKKLQLFYNKVMPVKGWMHYDTISVKWDYQVVATKRDKTVEAEPEYDPAEDEQADNILTMSVSDNSRAPVNKMVKSNHGSRQSSNSSGGNNGGKDKASAKPSEKNSSGEKKKQQ
jgi:hypothetical protein